MKFVISLVLAVVVAQVYNGADAACGFFNPFGCPAQELRSQYNAMKAANCRNCDKYFHCQGNYNAVYNCPGSRSSNKKVAETISDCREWWQDSSTADSQADQVANRFGRNGGNCQTEYLCKHNCKWSPRLQTCDTNNCP